MDSEMGCVAMIIPVAIGLILWGIRFNGKPSIIETLTISPSELADRELRRKGILPPREQTAHQDDGSGDPKWVQRVHEKQKQDFRK